jgi:hypothetical protein
MSHYPQAYAAVPTSDHGYQGGNVQQHQQQIPSHSPNYTVHQIHPHQSVVIGAPESSSTTFNTTQLLVPSDILRPDDPACLGSILAVFNWLYRAGFLFMYYLTLFFVMIAAPFIGCVVGGMEIVFHILRGFTRPIGRLVADAFGYGTWVNTSVALMEKKLQKV